MPAQNRNSVWCFGDSAGIDFSSGAPVAIASGMDGRGSCASIAGNAGQLLFYANTRAASGFTSTVVYNSNHQVMQNGNNIVGEGWYQELVIVPNPANDSTYYLFSLSVTGNYGIVYSKIDMKLNGGLGAVTIKNIQLQGFEQVDCLNAIKHGNGRDWWLIFRKSDYSVFGSNNDWYSYLVTPGSIQNFSVHSIGSQNRTDLGHTNFSSDGEKLVFTNLLGLTELYDFDRCTGLLSNPVTIEPDAGMPPFPFTWSCAFSPDASKLYVTACPQHTYLFQYDLNASNVVASKDTLWTISYPQYAGGGLKLAPDNKIYMAVQYYNGFNFPYPYPDSVYNMYNMNLPVINQPDSLGAACDFQPYSFFLGGKRTYLGLPNNPDYDMPALAGSPCDTLTGLNPGPSPKEWGAELFLTWVGSWQKLFVNAQGLKGRNVTVEVVDVSGKNLSGCCHAEVRGISQNSYFTKDIFLPNLSAGVYIVRLKTEKEVLAKKFVKE